MRLCLPWIDQVPQRPILVRRQWPQYGQHVYLIDLFCLGTLVTAPHHAGSNLSNW